MTLVVVMAFNILVALGLGFVVGRIYQIRRDELERRAEPPRPVYIPPSLAPQPSGSARMRAEGSRRISGANREANGRSIGHREAVHTRSRGCREVNRIPVPGEVDRIAGRQDLVRSRDQEVAAQRRQPPVPNNHAHKMRRESRSLRQMRK